MTEKLQNALNEQITAELWSANLYLSMSFYLEREGFSGMARWMQKQSAEEIGHAYAIAEYMIKREATPKVDKVDVVPQGWGNPVEVFEHALEHEKHVSKLIDELVQVASEEKDTSIGKAKSKKTFNVSAIVAAALKNGTVLLYSAELP